MRKPSWWIPDSCANALAPTIALLGWTAKPVRYDTSREAGVSCSVWTWAAELRELVGARPEGHHDLLQRRVAGALAEAVDGDLHLAGTRLDGGQRVRRREAEVVVAVDADGRVAADEVDDGADEPAELGRDRVAHGVGDVDGRGARLDDGLVDLEQERFLGPGRVLGGELDLRVRAQRLARPARPTCGRRRAPARASA